MQRWAEPPFDVRSQGINLVVREFNVKLEMDRGALHLNVITLQEQKGMLGAQS
jgi:hypothetical protein